MDIVYPEPIVIVPLFVKLGAGSRAEAVALALELGIVRRPHDSQTSP